MAHMDTCLKSVELAMLKYKRKAKKHTLDILLSYECLRIKTNL